MTSQSLTQEILKDFLHYDAETGIFIWKKVLPNAQRVRQGQRAGGASTGSYRIIGLFGQRYLEHRLAWLYVYGEWPHHQIDHINHDKSDNRINNLRDVPCKENHMNKKRRSDNTSGITGVYKAQNRWIAQGRSGQKIIHLGSFVNLEDAAMAKQKHDRELGYHPNHGT